MTSFRPAPGWLSEAVLYQIYPQSFADSNGDGIGDFAGITEHLDYLQWLGVDAVWLNPCFASPFKDAGYDISDFMTVAPVHLVGSGGPGVRPGPGLATRLLPAELLRRPAGAQLRLRTPTR